jgi:hypothetical protein
LTADEGSAPEKFPHSVSGNIFRRRNFLPELRGTYFTGAGPPKDLKRGVGAGEISPKENKRGSISGEISSKDYEREVVSEESSSRGCKGRGGADFFFCEKKLQIAWSVRNLFITFDSFIGYFFSKRGEGAFEDRYLRCFHFCDN